MDFREAPNINWAYVPHAGKHTVWLDTDTHGLFKEHLRDATKSSWLERLGWTRDNPTYKINHHGFRAPEFKKDEPNIVFLGCSHTVGVGINLSDTFSHHVSQSLGLQNYNLGKGGSSNQTAFRLGLHWIPKLKPKIVVLMSPSNSRSEIILGEQAINLGVHSSRDQPDLWPCIKARLRDEQNLTLDALAHQMALEKISTDVGAQFFKFEAEGDLKVVDQNTELDLGRDLLHPGKLTHKRTADHILAKIQKV